MVIKLRENDARNITAELQHLLEEAVQTVEIQL